MAARDVIRANSRAALGQLAEGEAWQWQARTSEPDATPAWAAAVTLAARRVDVQTDVVFDDQAQRYVERTTLQLCQYDDQAVRQGDLLVGEGRSWALVAIAATGQGLRRLTCQHDQPYLGTANRGGQP